MLLPSDGRLTHKIGLFVTFAIAIHANNMVSNRAASVESLSLWQSGGTIDVLSLFHSFPGNILAHGSADVLVLVQHKADALMKAPQDILRKMH